MHITAASFWWPISLAVVVIMYDTFIPSLYALHGWAGLGFAVSFQLLPVEVLKDSAVLGEDHHATALRIAH